VPLHQCAPNKPRPAKRVAVQVLVNYSAAPDLAAVEKQCKDIATGSGDSTGGSAVGGSSSGNSSGYHLSQRGDHHSV